LAPLNALAAAYSATRAEREVGAISALMRRTVPVPTPKRTATPVYALTALRWRGTDGLLGLLENAGAP
jgi:hypothetical protein